MKHLLVLLAVLFTHFSHADAWDNLTHEEAEQVVAELQKNPFIFGYCDCCGDDNAPQEAYLLKVTKTWIEACSWKPEQFSVAYQYEIVAVVVLTPDGGEITKLWGTDYVEYDDPIYMNYTWGLHPERKVATPFFNIVSYDYYGNDNTPCKKEFSYPHPKDLKGLHKERGYKVKGYKKWYKRAHL